MAARKRGTSKRMESAATDIGRALGKVAARVDALRQQRMAVAAEINDLIRSAQRMLADLGDDVAIARHRARKVARRAGARRNLSPEGRARIVAALKKRWDRFHAEQKGARRR